MIRGSNNPFDRDLPQWRATFSRAGRIDRNPSWTVQSEHHILTASWEQLESPLVGPPTINPYIVFTMLVFAACRPDAIRQRGRTRPPLSPRLLAQKYRPSPQFLLLCAGRNYGGWPRVSTIGDVGIHYL